VVPEPEPPFFLVAHAGSADHLEGAANHRKARLVTKESVDGAVGQGATMIELDACVTKDDMLVQSHVLWTPDGEPIRSRSFAELRAKWSWLRPLDESVSWVNNRTPIMVDVKTHPGDTAAVAVVADWLNSHLDARPSVCAKDLEVHKQLREAAPQVPRWLTIPQVDGKPRDMARQIASTFWTRRKRIGWRYPAAAMFYALSGLPSEHRLRLNMVNAIPWRGIEDDLPGLITEVGAVGLSVESSLATPELCKAAERLGIRVVAWVVNKTTDFERVMDAGVIGVTTDNLAAVSEIAKARLAAAKQQLQPAVSLAPRSIVG